MLRISLDWQRKYSDVYTLYKIVFLVQFVYIVLCKVCSAVSSAVYSVMCSVQSVVCTMQCTLYNAMCVDKGPLPDSVIMKRQF